MSKRKTIQKLEALLCALEQSQPVVANDPVEMERIMDKIIDYQCEYKKITGRYYDIHGKGNGGNYGKR